MSNSSTEKIIKYLIYLGVAVLLYIPFIISESLFFPFITGKAYTFRIVTEIIIGLWLILAVINPVYRPKNNWILYTFAIFLISLFISNLFGVNPTASFWSNYERMEGWVTIAHLFALFIALGSILRDKKEWIWLFNASIVASLFMVASAFGQVFESGFNTRVDTTLGNSTYLGIYMLINAFLSLFLLLRQKINFKSWPIYFYGTTFILQTVIIFQTGTRGSMLGLLGGLVLMALLIAILNKENKVFRKIAFSLLGVVIIFIGAIFIFKDSSAVQNIQPLQRIVTISPAEGTAKARITNWKIATEGFKERPILGWGQSNFNYVFDKHYLPEHHGNETWFDRVHNIFFDWLIAGGILGLLFYLSIWLATLYYIFRSQNFSANEKSVLVALLASYFFHNLFVFDQIVSYIYFIFILAFVYSQTGKEIESLSTPINSIRKNIYLSIIIILIPISIYVLNIPSLKANQELISALRIVNQKSDGTINLYHSGGIVDNIKYFEKAISRNTFGTSEIRQRALLQTSSILRIPNLDQEIKNQYAQFVVDQMLKEIEADPNNSRNYYLLGSFFAQVSQFDPAEEFLLKAIELSPNKQAIRIQLVTIYAGTDQSEKALALAKQTHELDESKDDLWEEYFKVVSKFEPEFSKELLSAEIEKENFERVENFLLKSIERNKDALNNRISLSAFYFQIGNASSSIKILEQAINDFPDAKKQLEELKKKIEAGENPVGKTF